MWRRAAAQSLPESVFAEACCPGTPLDTGVEKITDLYQNGKIHNRFNTIIQ